MSGLKHNNLSYGEAIYEALAQEMAVDPSVFVYGLGVDDVKGHYGTTLDLHKKFGPLRNFDMPLSEEAMAGVGVGAALNGMRPVYVHQRMDFLLLCMNQLVNMAAKLHYMSNGIHKVPMVVRASIGRSWGQGAQHSQALHSYFMHIPGIKVVAPTTPHDAKGTLISSIRDNNPVIYIEHRMLYANRGMVSSDNYEVELGKARILREGSDVTLVGVSYTVVDCLRAADLLAEVGISAEVIDPVSLSPFDHDTINRSAKKTGRLLVVDNGWLTCGASSEILANLMEQSATNIVAKRMGYAPSTCPTTRPLEDHFYPNPQSIAQQANEICGGDKRWSPQSIHRKEIEEFRGPF
ncbi:alpha-ketoacid dehydrogenase subunit beta [Kiloniella litopenaei]|uniref:alpha-ketoacid dehydrogenase subunit beta n=1 Tax=Kiloniella litopenaei TaxID=1549748 RepID=UPI003BAB791D